MEIVLEDLNGFSKLDGTCWRVGKVQYGDVVQFNLKNIIFLEPAGVIILLLLCIYCFKKTGCEVILTNVRPEILRYLKRVGLFEFGVAFAEEIKSWRRVFPGRSLSVIEVTKITGPNEIAKFVSRTKSILTEWFPGSQYQEYITSATTVIMEFCGNSIEHSLGSNHNGECYCMLQKYEKNNRIQISIAVGDLGIGIKQHLKHKHGWIGRNDSEYIEKAIGGLTGRIDGSGGMGLKRIKAITSDFNGIMVIRSGKGIVTVGNDLSSRDFKVPLKGTQCKIDLTPSNR